MLSNQDIKSKVRRNKYLRLFVLIIFIYSKSALEGLYTEMALFVQSDFYNLNYLRLCGLYTAFLVISNFSWPVLPLTACLSTTLQKSHERKTLLIFLALLVAGLLLRIDYRSLASSGPREPQSFFFFISGALLLLVGSLCCEVVTVVILSKISAPIFGLGLLIAEGLSGFGSTLGRSLGPIFVGLAMTDNSSGIYGIELYFYLALASLGVFLLVLLLVLFKKLQRLSHAQQIVTEKAKLPTLEQSQVAIPLTFQPFVGKPNKGL